MAVGAWCLASYAPDAMALPAAGGGGGPAPTMYGYAAGPRQHNGTAAGHAHFVRASATRARPARGSIKGHRPPRPDLALPLTGRRARVRTGRARMAAGHEIVLHQIIGTPPAMPANPASVHAKGPAPSQRPSPSPSPTGSHGAAPSPSPSPSGAVRTTSAVRSSGAAGALAGGGTDNASYTAASTFDTAPMADQGGWIAVTLTNTGTSTWGSGYALGSQVFPASDPTGTGTPLSTGSNVVVSGTVTPGGTVTVESVTPPENPGSYTICWDMVNAASQYFSAEGATEYCAPYTVQQYPAAINEQEPLPGTDVDSQTPLLSASATVPGGYPADPEFSFAFQILSGPNPGATVLQSSGWVANNGNSWTPAKSLSWGSTYYWRATVTDAATPPSLTGPGITWTTPISFVVGNAQPAVLDRLGNAYQADDGNPVMTSDLGGTDYSGSGKTVDPRTGNIAQQVTDATVATVGPALSIKRTYNSQDPRTSQAFGAGWSSLLDSSLVPDPDGSGALVLTMADGRQVRFAKTSAGGYAPPQDMYAVVTALSGSGFSVTDQTGTTYTFAQPSGSSWLISKVTDSTGMAETFSYASGVLTAITNTTSGRALHFTWTTPGGASYPHVATVSTDAVTAGQSGTALTWTYGYNGDLLTSVCSPVSATACTSYSYITNGSHAATSVLNADPASYFRLNDPAGATAAANQIPVNDLTTVNPPAAEFSTTLGVPGPVPGVSATGFNGTSSFIPLDGAWCTTPGQVSSCISVPSTGRVLTGGGAAESLGISVWFKTSTASGVLMGLTGSLPSSQNCSPYCVDTVEKPLLWIGGDGHLQGYSGAATAMSSPTAVNDGAWHQAVLIPGQALYLDGTKVATSSAGFTPPSGAYALLGAGTIAQNPWYASWSFFHGSMADLSIYQNQLPSVGTVAAQYAAETQPAAELTSETSPAGRTMLAAVYDTASDRVSSLTDAYGGKWTYGAPVAGSSSAAYDGAVMGSSPEDFWPLSDTAGPLATDMVGSSGPTGGNPRPPATYTSVTLGGPGPTGFPDGTAASFNGSNSQISIPGGYFAGAGSESVELWFNTTSSGTLLSTGSGPAGGEPMGLSVSSPGGCLVGSVGSTQVDQPLFGICSGTNHTITDGKWHQAILTVSPQGTSPAGGFSQTVTLYLDGAQIATAQVPSPATPSATGYTAYLGNGSSGALNGSIADVSFYTDQLTSTEVTGHYNALHNQVLIQLPITNPFNPPSYLATPTLNTQTITVTDPAGKTTNYTYATGALVRAVNVLGGVTTYGYDSAGRASTTTDPVGDTTYTTFDAHNNVTSVTTCAAVNACQTAYASYYENLANPLDPRNDKPTDDRDARSSSPYDPAYDTVTSYTPTGQIASKTTPPTSACPSGCKMTYAYTAGTEPAPGGGTEPAGLLASLISPGGGVTRYAYNSAGDVMQVTSPLGLVTSYTYDNLGRELTQTQVSDSYPAGLTTRYTYDGLDRVLTETDPPVTDRVTGAVHTKVITYTYDPDSSILTTTVGDATGGDPSRTTTDTYNAYGELASATDPLGNTVSYTYDAIGDRITATDPAGVTTDYTYDAAGDLLTSTLMGYTGNPANPSPPVNLVVEARAYDPAGRLASVTNAVGTTTGYTYFGDNRMASSFIVDPGGGHEQVTTYGYDAAGNQVTESDPGGLVTNAVYNAGSQMVSLTQDPSGVDRTITASYDAGGNVVSDTVSQGNSSQTVTASYDAAGLEMSHTVADGATNLTTTYTRDQRGLVTSMTDPAGNTTQIQNDEAGRPVVVVQPAVPVQSGQGGAPVTARPVAMTGYDTFGDQTEYSDANGNVATAAYNADGEQVSATAPSYTPPGSSAPVTGTTTMTYNSLGQEKSQTDPLGNTSTTTYDQLGHIAAQTDANGGVWTYTYDPAGEQTSVTDPTGARTQATYDDLGRLITTTDLVRQNASAAYTTSFGYDAAGNLTSQTSPAGVTGTATFNALGQQTSTTDGAGNTTTYAYNLDGSVTKVTLPDGSAETMAYDPAGRPVSTSDLSASGTVLRTASVGYDAAGNITSETNFLGNTATATYDATGEVLTQTDPVSAGQSITVRYGYDLSGNMTSLTGGNGNTTYATYNSLGLPETITEPATAAHSSAADSTTTDSYDANGNLVTESLPGGVQVSNTYDAMGNLTGQSGTGATAPTAARTFTYDAAGRLLTAATGAAGSAGTPGYQAPTSESFSYDDRGLLLSASGSAGTSSFTYNASAQLTSATDAAGTSTYTYDATGRLATDADAASGTTGSYSYNTLSQVTRISYGSGNDTQSFGYDALHRLTSDTVSTSAGAQVAAIGYGYDANNNVTSMTTSGLATPGGTGTVSNTYGYDQANRLTSWTATPQGGTATTAAYGYDADGNLTSNNGVTQSYDARDELVSDAGGNTYAYTANGDLAGQTGPGGTSYTSTSDAYGQQSTSGSASSYTYDALGRLVGAGSLSGNGSRIALTYDGASIEVASDSSASYSRDPSGQIVGVNAVAGGPLLALSNAHGDLSGVFTASATALAGSTTYSPWGQVLATSGPALEVGYQGQWTDPVTQQVDMGSRFYRPGSGGFGNQDTYTGGEGGAAVTDDLHAYADDNPMSVADPSGHSPSGDGGGPVVTKSQVDAAAARAQEAAQTASYAEAAASRAWSAASAADRAASADAAYARQLNRQAAGLLQDYNNTVGLAKQAFADGAHEQSIANQALAQANSLRSSPFSYELVTIGGGGSGGGSTTTTGGTCTGVGVGGVVPVGVGVAVTLNGTGCVSGGVTNGSGGVTIAHPQFQVWVLKPGVAAQIQSLENTASQAQQQASSDDEHGMLLMEQAASIHDQYEAARAAASVAEGRAQDAAAFAAEQTATARYLSGVAAADEQAAKQAEAAYLQLEKEYQAEQNAHRQQPARKKQQSPKVQPPHQPPSPVPPVVPPSRQPDKKTVTTLAHLVTAAAEAVAQVTGIQAVVSSIAHCVGQPSLGSCLRAAANVLLLLIGRGAGEGASGAAFAADDGSAAAASGARFAVDSNGEATDLNLVRPPGPYVRPPNATTAAQRASVQGRPCVDCGNITTTQIADHKDPLVKEYYRTGTIDLVNMHSLDAVQPQCPSCSGEQGRWLAKFAQAMKQVWGF